MMKILFASENDKIGPHVFYQWYKTNFIDENNIDEDEIRTFIQG